ncbi:MAG: hypothetical protein CMP95_08470 [Gammaproteobacteria bacterium]|uniref:Regulatory signaling modulator protein AmpE n=1 Tax=OM182 bacterium TaxID=2510334 RepID=A0A520S4T4_9GAMM|nr:hypothetical protein [Gammaproteobacteria bacterium]OUV67518.1 MAG: hypothetical protein CBC93_04390 [Gammaproteobacteria bacterium TMED133]RZO77492.1 MAG: hypothetical protein EVA68_01170 [OM182 bacterium]
MNFLLILAIVLVHRNWFGGNLAYNVLPLDGWFATMLGIVTSSSLRFVFAVVVPTTFLCLVCWVIGDWLFGFLYLLLCIFVLLLSVDVLDLDGYRGEQNDAVTNQLPYLFFQSIFPSLFWFLVLGPIGVFFYFLSERYLGYCENGRIESFGVERILYWMEWIPIRLTGFIFALLGEFRSGFSVWVDSFIDIEISNAEFLNSVARAAILLKEEDKEESEVPLLHWLLEKTVWGWVAFAAILTIWGW